MSTTFNPYEVLEVNSRASPEVIRASYLALVHKYNTEDPEKNKEFKDVLKAWQILSDAEKKSLFDEQSKNLNDKIIGGSYRVIKRIGQGDYYYDYLGENIFVNLPVLIRQCSEISLHKEEVLLRETKILWDLRHHGLSLIRHLFRLDDGSLIIVMTYTPGTSLEEWVKTKKGPLKPKSVIWMAQRAINSLLYLHERKIIHGGINPRNLFTQDHTVFLANLNRFKLNDIEDPDAREYAKIFAPPEEESGLPLLPESDFYSLGLTMIYGLSGGIDYVIKRMVPDSVPEPMVQFIRRLILQEVEARPNWDKTDLYEEILKVRKQSFGSLTSDKDPVQGLNEE
jgi:serine/threonine protein kinase